jgi:hypothetical protein
VIIKPENFGRHFAVPKHPDPKLRERITIVRTASRRLKAVLECPLTATDLYAANRAVAFMRISVHSNQVAEAAKVNLRERFGNCWRDCARQARIHARYGASADRVVTYGAQRPQAAWTPNVGTRTVPIIMGCVI